MKMSLLAVGFLILLGSSEIHAGEGPVTRPSHESALAHFKRVEPLSLEATRCLEHETKKSWTVSLRYEEWENGQGGNLSAISAYEKSLKPGSLNISINATRDRGGNAIDLVRVVLMYVSPRVERSSFDSTLMPADQELIDLIKSCVPLWELPVD
ncbi:MAG: hypothetical protein AAB036_07765 [Elusimicrobiota bacterium]